MECQQAGVQISDISLFIENNFFRIPHDRIGSQWFLLAGIEHLHSGYHVVKRLIDVGISLVALFLLSPVMAVIAALSSWKAAGRHSTRRTALGKTERCFGFGSLDRCAPMPRPRARSGRKGETAGSPGWALSCGKHAWMKRRSSGTSSMEACHSLVPAPSVQSTFRVFEAQIPLYRQRNLIKPGLTGWAQINYPYGAGLKDAAAKLQFDLFYIKKMSPSIDFQILLRTVGSIMKGAR